MTPPSGQLPLEQAEDLARQAREGSSACFARLVVMYHARLYNFLLRRTLTSADAEDLTQESFVRAWERIESYKPGYRFSTWLFTIGSRLASNHRRDGRRTVGSLDSDPAIDANPAAPEMAREEHRRIWALAARLLSEDQREVVYLRYVEGMEPADIARVLGKTSIGVRVLLFRARERLAGALSDDREEARRPSPVALAVECPEPFGGGS